jgi:hypothetical protein
MSTRITVRERKQTLPFPPTIETKACKSIAFDFGTGEIDLRPPYQRGLRWNQEQMRKFIGTIMMGGYVPSILLYLLHSTDANYGKYQVECVDGQHRLFVIINFIKGEYVKLSEKTKPFMVTWYHPETKTHVFYSDTDATRKWAAEHNEMHFDYMTPEEKRAFDKFTLQITTINTPLSLDDRKRTFTSLQCGTKVTGSDFLKNLDVRLVQYMFNECFEDRYKSLLLLHSINKPDRFWLQIFIRFYFMTIGVADSVLIKDKEFDAMIKRHDPVLDTSDRPDLEQSFNDIMQRYFAFIERIDPSIRFPRIALLAMFQKLIDAPSGYEDILLTWLPRGWSWANVTSTSIKNMHEGTKTYEPVHYNKMFKECLSELNVISVPFVEDDPRNPRKSIPKSVREVCFRNAFGDAFEGTCFCCQDRFARDGEWEAGHITSWASGGTDDISNLRPICRACNRSMGIRHMDEFKACYYASLGEEESDSEDEEDS